MKKMLLSVTTVEALIIICIVGYVNGGGPNRDLLTAIESALNFEEFKAK
jgi:phage-related baseplate assembly protein